MSRGIFLTNSIRTMTENTKKLEISLFDEKTNFMIWQSTIQDLLVQQGLDFPLKDEKSVVMGEMQKNYSNIYK